MKTFIEVVSFNVADVITTSGGSDCGQYAPCVYSCDDPDID